MLATQTPKRTRTSAKNLPIVEELHFRSDSSFLCLILNRRTKLVRMVDFRSGALPAKRLFIQAVAQREKVGKVITLVEKDEVSSWLKVGFVREGTIPGFYKRSDAHLLGCVINDSIASLSLDPAAVREAERSVAAGKRNLDEITEDLSTAEIKAIEPSVAFRARDEAWRKNDALGSFDDFGRNAATLYISSSYRRGRTNHLRAEIQDCFGHAHLEILKTPQDDLDVLAITAGLRHFATQLQERGIVALFGFAPVDDIGLATAYTAAGFRKTGLMASGCLVGNTRKDAIVWSRKMELAPEETQS